MTVCGERVFSILHSSTFYSSLCTFCLKLITVAPVRPGLCVAMSNFSEGSSQCNSISHDLNLKSLLASLQQLTSGFAVIPQDIPYGMGSNDD